MTDGKKENLWYIGLFGLAIALLFINISGWVSVITLGLVMLIIFVFLIFIK